MTNTQQNHFHFRWAPVSRQINFDRLSYNFVQMANHVEGHHEITNKNDLFRNVKNFLDERNLNAFHVMPITFYVKVTLDAKEGSLKKQLSPFKQVFNLLDEFKELFDSETNKFVAPPPKSPRSEPGGESEEALQKAESSGKKKRSKKEKS